MDQEDDGLDLSSYLDFLLDNKRLIAAIAVIVTLFGFTYALISTPIYETNILVQVEDSGPSSGNILGDLSSAFELKTAASAEMEILRSRFVLTRAVNNARLYIDVQPRRFPVIGSWIARRNAELSDPGLFGFGGYGWGAEQAIVPVFSVPESLQGEAFMLTVEGEGLFRLSHVEHGIEFTGRVGAALVKETPFGPIELQVERLSAKSGAMFSLVRQPVLAVVEGLQGSLSIAERGKQSGIIGVSLQGADPVKTAATLNEIGREYIGQNIDRKSEEAEKSLNFLDKQLPQLKRELEDLEGRYNAVRNSRGTIDLGEEAKVLLGQSVAAQSRLIDLRQKREELRARYQDANPIVVTINQQIRTAETELQSISALIRKLPSIEQDVFRITRDVKVNTEIYTSLLNRAQQLRLVKASKVGNARLLDQAVQPLRPIKPQRSTIVALAALIGLFLGVLGAFVRKSLFGSIEDPHEIEQMLGLTVSAAVPHSDIQALQHAHLQTKAKKVSLLAQDSPTDGAVESLRSFRTSFQFSMLDASNNIVMITGPTPGLGKSFISANFAAVLAGTGKKILLVDADLRKGYLHRYFGLDRQAGLSDVIAAQLSVEQVIHRNVAENVDFIATGALPPRPAELLAHSKFNEFLLAVAGNYDFVIIDTAPVLAVSDALVVAPHVGAIFNVVRGGVTRMGEIEETVKRFRQAGAEVTGLVFNDMRLKAGRYGYGSKYGKYKYAQYKY